MKVRMFQSSVFLAAGTFSTTVRSPAVGAAQVLSVGNSQGQLSRFRGSGEELSVGYTTVLYGLDQPRLDLFLANDF